VKDFRKTKILRLIPLLKGYIPTAWGFRVGWCRCTKIVFTCINDVV